MAVVYPFSPDLSGAFGNIQRALQAGANIAENTPGNAALAAAATAPLAAVSKERNEDTFKASLEDQLNQHKIMYAAQAEGRKMVTPDDTSQMEKQSGLSPGTLDSLKGVMLNPEEIQNYRAAAARKVYMNNMQDQIRKNDPKTGEERADALGMSLGVPGMENITRWAVTGHGAIRLQKMSDGYTYPVDEFTGQPISTTPLDFSMPTVDPGGKDPTGMNYVKDFGRLSKQSQTTVKQAMKDYNKEAEPIKSSLDQFDKATVLLNNPDAKAIGQNIAIMSQARSAAGTMRNWKEFQIAEGLPDIANKAGRLFDKAIDGEALTGDDKKALTAVLGAFKDTGNKELQRIESTYVNQTTGTTHFDPKAMHQLLNSSGGSATKQIILQDKDGNKFTLKDPSKLQDKIKAGYTVANQ